MKDKMKWKSRKEGRRMDGDEGVPLMGESQESKMKIVNIQHSKVLLLLLSLVYLCFFFSFLVKFSHLGIEILALHFF